MKSIFHSQSVVTHEGVDYRLEADQTIEGTPFFRVTNLETDESGTCRRKDERALLTPTSTLSHAMEDALAEAVDVIIPKGYTRADVGDGRRE